MVEFIFNCLVCALGVYFTQPVSILLEFTLRAELKLQTGHRYLSVICFVFTPALCLYSTFAGGSILLPCFVALAGYLVGEQDALIHETALIIGELEDEKSTHIVEMQEALKTMDQALKAAFIAQNVSLILSSDKEDLATAVEEQAETIVNQNERWKEVRNELNEAKRKEAILERELFEVKKLLEEDETERLLPMSKEYLLIGAPRKAHRNGAKGSTLRTHRNG